MGPVGQPEAAIPPAQWGLWGDRNPLRVVELQELLRGAQPGWTARELAAADAKLRQIGVESPGMLADALQGRINDRLRRKGLKAFSTETLGAIRESLRAQYPDLTVIGADADRYNGARYPGNYLDGALIEEVKARRFDTVHVFKCPTSRYQPVKGRRNQLHQIVMLFDTQGGGEGLQLEFFLDGVHYQRKEAPTIHRQHGSLVAISRAPAAPGGGGFSGEAVAGVLRTWLAKRREMAGATCIAFAVEVVEAAGAMSPELQYHFQVAMSEMGSGTGAARR